MARTVIDVERVPGYRNGLSLVEPQIWRDIAGAAHSELGGLLGQAI